MIELLLEDGAPVRVCFAARELLDAPADSRVVLLHAARDAEFLNMVRPVVSERRLRVLVWLRPGDRRELSRRARDFLDWMQEMVDVPEFVPGYAERALRRALDEGAAIVWEGPPLRELIPGAIVLLAGDVDQEIGITAMRAGPVVVHRPRDEGEIACFEAMHRAAGSHFGLVWDEPAVVPAGVPRVIAEPLDWEVASEWLAEAGVDEPRLEAAKLHLDPVAISRRARRDPPLPAALTGAAPPASAVDLPASERSGGAILPPRNWWEELFRFLDPRYPTEDPALILPRPAAWSGLGSLVGRLSSRIKPEIHVVTGAVGSGVSTELLSLGLQLEDHRCVVMFDAWHHFMGGIQDPAAIERLTSCELVALLGVATIRVGRDRWGVRWGKEAYLLRKAIHAMTGANVDIDDLASALAGAGAPGNKLPSAGSWSLPIGTAHAPSASKAPSDELRQELARAVRLIVEELRLSTGREVVLVVDGLSPIPRMSLVDEVIDSLRSVAIHADMVLTAPLELPPRPLRQHHIESFSHIDDVPVLDIDDPARHGPGIAFLRTLLELRFACISSARPLIPEVVLNRLCWASGGRPRECLSLVRDLALLAFDEHHRSLHELTEEVLRNRMRQMDPITREEHGLLRSLLQELVTDIPDDETARSLYSLGLLRLYPAPGVGHRALPHPLLIEDLLRG